MTRASLLHVLDHLSEISDAEVRELEQLASAFPYCQTAHLLLAKVAHDRGSMLASQRLRRAATYATNRQLLRQLIEFTPSAPTAVVTQAAELPPVANDNTVVAEAPPEAANDLRTAASFKESATESVFEVAFSNAVAEPLPTEAEAVPSEHEAVAVTEAASTPGETNTSSTEPLFKAATEETTAFLSTVPDEEARPLIAVGDSESTASLETVPPVEVTYTSPSAAAAEESPVISELEAEPEQLGTENLTVAEESVLLPEELLPAVAPPIRPPLEAGSSQFEFGLTEPTTPIAPVYELIGAEELETDSATTTIVPAFYGADDIGYALGAGSRMGYCLQSPDELTLHLPSGDFEPDALLLAHVVAHQPPTPTRTSVDIISQFLRNKPRLKTPAATLPPADEQADLSVKSTRAEPDLASESLALIMVRQGKKDRAIEIYERLMVRQPEKMAYFADQIQKLKLSE